MTTLPYKCAAICVVMLLLSIRAMAQERTDSLIINVGKSRVIFLVRDKQDLKTLESYDLNAILRQLNLRLEKDSTGQLLVKEDDGEQIYMTDTTIVVAKTTNPAIIEESGAPDDANDDRKEQCNTPRYEQRKGTSHFFNIDLGMNNYLQEGDFPDENDAPYTVKPFGSWYIGVASTNLTSISKRFFLEWGPAITWYNFKFQNKNIGITEEPDGVVFTENVSMPDVEFKKSKLTVAYVNISLLPVFHFGANPGRKNGFFDWADRGGFRIGAGGYGGYRIASYTKMVYDNGDKERDKNKENFHLNNFRYGLRLQIGYRGTDFFFNYDMNELFVEGKGPKLNAFSFGLIL